MDFNYHYTEEQAQFRLEVRAWLQENIPPHIKAPIDRENITDEEYEFALDLRKKLGAKAWLYPTYPKEFGGGGLTAQHEVILQEEFRRRKVPTVFSNDLVLPSILVWGTDEQKQEWLPGIMRGETICFQNFTEPQSGSDLASIECTAVRDGDEWIINGQKIFVSGGGPGRADMLFGPMKTDPDAPRHKNLGYFLIPAETPGLRLTSMELLNGHNQHTVMMDDVRVPHRCLLGGETQGWQVTQTTLEAEHGGRGRALPIDEALDNNIEYVKHTKVNGGTLGQDPYIRQQVVDSFLDYHVYSLIEKRNHWMYTGRQEMTYHGSQSALYRKEYQLRNADRARDILGPYAILDTKDPAAPNEGAPEVFQRSSLTAAHPGGTVEVQKVVIARRLGISRTKEKAAPTPATATSYTS